MTPQQTVLIYRHKKRGSTYKILHEGAVIEATEEKAVVYQCLESGIIWIRPETEFFDGRFERIEDQGA